MRFFLFVTLTCLAGTLSAQRINHAGRILGPLLPVNQPTLFNTPEADAIVGSMQIYPRDNAWNEDISNRPLLANSAAMISAMTGHLDASRRTLRAFFEMNFVLVPDNQAWVPIDFFEYPGESDPSPYPIPLNMPIEGWPRETGSLTLDQWQRDINGTGGDRHSIIVKPGTGQCWETWQARKLLDNSWEAANGALFNLNSNALRPLGWTSGDAAGLSMFAGILRYDEVLRGQVEHALRIVVRRTRAQYIYPASHYASNPFTTDPNVPAMGQRMRLRSTFNVPSTWTNQEKAVCAALKKYGAIVADNGNFFQISVAPDQRWPSGCFDNLTSIGVGEFDIIQTTGPTEGPRSPNPPVANAGPDLNGTVGPAVALNGSTSGGTGTVTRLWTKYSGPGNVTFANSASAATTATFSANGVYTLMLRASDAVHTPGYDAVVVTIGSTPTVTGTLVLQNVGASAYPTSVLFEYRTPGTSNVVFSSNGAIGSGGAFTIPSPPTAGSYDLAVKYSHWLRRKIAVNTSAGNVTGVVLSLRNGDLDGDNEIGIGDYAQLSSNYGGTGAGDLNHDGVVDIADYAILSSNYGLVGD